jgi:MinD superfamily P-loop ATPase
MKEIVVISGKGGTGKTSLVASFAAMAKDAVFADCDVDAADLHLILSPDIKQCNGFRSGHTALIRQADCIHCGACLKHCRFEAVKVNGCKKAATEAEVSLKDAEFSALNVAWTKYRQRELPSHYEVRDLPSPPEGGEGGVRGLSGCEFTAPCTNQIPATAGNCVSTKYAKVSLKDAEFSIDPIACEGCGVCVWFCPAKAIDFPERDCGEWFVSQTRFGPMVHARLDSAAENSGKLVTIVRKEARRIALEAGSNLILVDGPPGIGCPAIASISGASLVVVVTEPTISGEHDLERVLSLTRHFGIQAAVCVNKWDLNQDMAERIERRALSFGGQVLERISYDRDVTAAMVNGKAVVEYSDGQAAQDIRKGWQTLCHMIG